eukprot:scaffold114815_cov60-Phaeocystis_antarctica.AAC.1
MAQDCTLLGHVLAKHVLELREVGPVSGRRGSGSLGSDRTAGLVSAVLHPLSGHASHIVSSVRSGVGPITASVRSGVGPITAG